VLIFWADHFIVAGQKRKGNRAGWSGSSL
jgi:hypothetical protein